MVGDATTISQVLKFIYAYILIPLRNLLVPMVQFFTTDLGEALRIEALNGVSLGAMLFAQGFFFVVFASIIKLFNPLS